MPKYMVERKIGHVTAQVLLQAGRRSVRALKTLRGQVQWVQSYVTQDTIYSIYIAPSEREIRRHGKASGLPCSEIKRVVAMVDPSLFGA